MTRVRTPVPPLVCKSLYCFCHFICLPKRKLLFLPKIKKILLLLS